MSPNQSEKAEILAPVGSYETLYAALNAGCDAIYFGVTQLNMRAASLNNFNLSDLAEIAKICHKRNVRCYLTLNTILYDHDINLTKKIIDAVKEHGIDAIIVSDMAATAYAAQVGVEAHLSTQMSISNIETILFYAPYTDRIVLARELNLQMISNICKQIKEQNIRGRSGRLMEIEVFIHGAMCVAISGRCGMSLYTHNSSANRGACKQNCRRAYTVIDEDGNKLKVDNEFVMSPEDMCTIGFLDKIIATGVKVLKIEGRGRSPEYVDTVVRCYREAVDAIYEGTYSQEKIDNWYKRLEKVYNRGLGTGYYLGKQMKEWSGAYGSKATEEKTYIGDIIHYYPKASVAEITIFAGTISNNEKFYIIGPKTGILTVKPDLIRNAEEKEIISAQKGDTITIKVPERVREGDKVYVVRKSQLASGS